MYKHENIDAARAKVNESIKYLEAQIAEYRSMLAQLDWAQKVIETCSSDELLGIRTITAPILTDFMGYPIDPASIASTMGAPKLPTVKQLTLATVMIHAQNKSLSAREIVEFMKYQGYQPKSEHHITSVLTTLTRLVEEGLIEEEPDSAPKKFRAKMA